MRLTALTAVLFAIVLANTVGSTKVHAATTTKTSNTKTTVKSKKIVKQVPVVQPQQTIVVGPGDNLSDLAASNNTTMLRLFYANAQIVNPDLIYPGEILVVPNANAVLTPRSLPVDVVTSAAVTTSTNVDQSSDQTVTPQTSQVTQAVQASPQNAGVWDQIAACESGGNWAIDTGNGYYGGLQFSLSSWQAMGGTGLPNQASPAEQIAVAEALQKVEGWGAWPACSEKVGL